MNISDFISFYSIQIEHEKLIMKTVKNINIFYEIFICAVCTMQAVVKRMSKEKLRRCLRAATIAEPEVMQNFIAGKQRV